MRAIPTSAGSWHTRLRPFIASLALAVVSGCQTVPPSDAPSPSPSSTSEPPTAPPANAATRAAATKAHLASEKTRLASLFRGTPVVFALQRDGSLRVEVPLPFSFDTGKAAVKPPLAAVLDRLVAGQLNELTRLSISAPSDATASAPALAGERARNARDHCVAKGLSAQRVSIAAGGSPGLVIILVSDVAPS